MRALDTGFGDIPCAPTVKPDDRLVFKTVEGAKAFVDEDGKRVHVPAGTNMAMIGFDEQDCTVHSLNSRENAVVWMAESFTFGFRPGAKRVGAAEIASEEVVAIVRSLPGND